MRLKKKELEKIIKEANSLLSEEYSTGVEDTDEKLSAWGGKCYINAGPDREINEKIALPFRALGIPKVICDLISIKVYNQDPADTPDDDDDDTTTTIFNGDYFDSLTVGNVKPILADKLGLNDSDAAAIALKIDGVLTDLITIEGETRSEKLDGLKKAQVIFPTKITNTDSSVAPKTDSGIRSRINSNSLSAQVINKEVTKQYKKAIKFLVTSDTSTNPPGPPANDPAGREKLRKELEKIPRWSKIFRQ